MTALITAYLLANFDNVSTINELKKSEKEVKKIIDDNYTALETKLNSELSSYSDIETKWNSKKLNFANAFLKSIYVSLLAKGKIY